MIDWSTIYASEVAPALANFKAPIPPPIWGLLAAFALAGVAALVFIPNAYRLVGLVPLGLVGFVLFMVSSQRVAATEGTVYAFKGTVTAKRVTKHTKENTVGITEATYVYHLDVVVEQEGELTAAGATLRHKGIAEQLTSSEAVYEGLSEGDTLIGVRMPTGPNHVFRRVLQDGRLVK